MVEPLPVNGPALRDWDEIVMVGTLIALGG